MSKLQWLNKLPDNDIKNLVESIDIVLFDLDGTLLHDKSSFPGANNTVAKLRALGKKIGFVTNNPAYIPEYWKKFLHPIEAVEGEIVTPNVVLLDYLKKTGFDKDIFAVTCPFTKTVLRNAGYKVIEYKDIQTEPLAEQISGPNGLKNLAKKVLSICKNVGLVYLDVDINVQYGALQVSQTILNQINDCKLLSGMSDDVTSMGKMLIICSHFYISAMERWTNKQALQMAKPGITLTKYLVSKYKIADASRVLMIGDNVLTDMAFGVNSGFKTCLVLGNLSSTSLVQNWTYPEEYKPDYVISEVAEIFPSIKDF
ncbi:uncharacterized protein LOC126748272 [Anthonomus grandis grandis]|uniref:uncharacterized protein LOC126748272 n=1 Tax=Anthonomus grandis grandis TaxID=2921223 RepID=UPI002165FE67|nr:uncharacterized protein LOC126748272 [Anthonomus grandis grandis]